MTTTITQSNFNTAIALWFSDQTSCISTYGHISDWDTSAVTNMFNAFRNKTTFNEDIGNWNVSGVTNMKMMFYGASTFSMSGNSLDLWDVSSVTDMSHMFRDCLVFNPSSIDWGEKMSGVTSTYYMFNTARAFDAVGISGWNVSGVIDMRSMFGNCDKFNQPLNSWDVSNVTDMAIMFTRCYRFNQPLNSWETYSVHTMSGMFSGGYYSREPEMVFNQDLSSWYTSNVTDISSMFRFNTSFNNGGVALDWDTSSVTNMLFTFAVDSPQRDDPVFNQDLSTWDTSNVRIWSRCLTVRPNSIKILVIGIRVK